MCMADIVRTLVDILLDSHLLVFEAFKFSKFRSDYPVHIDPRWLFHSDLLCYIPREKIFES